MSIIFIVNDMICNYCVGVIIKVVKEVDVNVKVDIVVVDKCVVIDSSLLV